MMRRSIFPRIDPGRLAATDSILLLVPSVNFQRQHSPRVHQFGEKARGLPVPAFLLPSRALKRLAASGANFPLSRSLSEHICHHVLSKVGRHGRVSCSVRGPKRSALIRTQVRTLRKQTSLSYSSMKFGSYIDRLRGASSFAKRYLSASTFNGIARRCLVTVSGDGAF